MVVVEIEYCVPCGLLESALHTQRELLGTFGRELDEVRLKPGHGGVFRVAIEDDIIFDKAVHGNEIAIDPIVDAVEQRFVADD